MVFHRHKVADLGISLKAYGASVDRQQRIGTVAYESPEVVGGQEYSYATDVWSLGVVAYEMCTLERPFKGETFEEVREQILTAEPAPIPVRQQGEMGTGMPYCGCML